MLHRGTLVEFATSARRAQAEESQKCYSVFKDLLFALSPLGFDNSNTHFSESLRITENEGYWQGAIFFTIDNHGRLEISIGIRPTDNEVFHIRISGSDREFDIKLGPGWHVGILDAIAESLERQISERYPMCHR